MTKVSPISNIFSLPSLSAEELFETLLSRDGVLIERIVSQGQITPSGKWWDQPQDEWVILLQGLAELSYESGERIKLRAGDYLLIPGGQKHRLEFTSVDPPCIWLAIHFDGNRE